MLLAVANGNYTVIPEVKVTGQLISCPDQFKCIGIQYYDGECVTTVENGADILYCKACVTFNTWFTDGQGQNKSLCNTQTYIASVCAGDRFTSYYSGPGPQYYVNATAAGSTGINTTKTSPWYGQRAVNYTLDGISATCSPPRSVTFGGGAAQVAGCTAADVGVGNQCLWKFTVPNPFYNAGVLFVCPQPKPQPSAAIPTFPEPQAAHPLATKPRPAKPSPKPVAAQPAAAQPSTQPRPSQPATTKPTTKPGAA
ncbi:hypothetical protein HYH03_016887 [Edaphochlamys debaryana]|uniref:Uncharacterized protein n=1 Tax=Edaphochlamys debaryana TaxID=47281 RepID=A0A836BPQ6_9CHLO|nr:hypothetical protein HYH03_016887 [Edaphochlamys debaryana]|eukprot:KAG2484345.1 hypothetical protein HYH03_016887 [Edaphochlamys debaryana]